MKKLFAFMLVLAMLLPMVLISVGAEGTDPTTTEPIGSNNAQEANKEAQFVALALQWAGIIAAALVLLGISDFIRKKKAAAK